MTKWVDINKVSSILRRCHELDDAVRNETAEGRNSIMLVDGLYDCESFELIKDIEDRCIFEFSEEEQVPEEYVRLSDFLGMSYSDFRVQVPEAFRCSLESHSAWISLTLGANREQFDAKLALMRVTPKLSTKLSFRLDGIGSFNVDVTQLNMLFTECRAYDTSQMLNKSPSAKYEGTTFYTDESIAIIKERIPTDLKSTKNSDNGYVHGGIVSGDDVPECSIPLKRFLDMSLWEFIVLVPEAKQGDILTRVAHERLVTFAKYIRGAIDVGRAMSKHSLRCLNWDL